MCSRVRKGLETVPKPHVALLVSGATKSRTRWIRYTLDVSFTRHNFGDFFVINEFEQPIGWPVKLDIFQP